MASTSPLIGGDSLANPKVVVLGKTGSNSFVYPKLVGETGGNS